MTSKRWSRAFAATVTASLLSSSTAFALPTEWSEFSPSLGDAQEASRGHAASRSKVRLMAEMPRSVSHGQWTDTRSVHVFPTAVNKDFTVTRLIDTRAFCPRVSQYLGRINTTEDGVMDILSVGLTQAQQIGALINNADAFKTANGNAFEIVSRVQARIGNLGAQISAYTAAITELEETISLLQSQITTLTAARDAAAAAAINGVPPGNAQITALQQERTTLEGEINNLNTIIAALEGAGVDATVFRTQRTTKQNRVAAIATEINTLAAPYRAQKRAEADALTAQIDGKAALVATKQAAIDTNRQLVIDRRLEVVDELVADDYIVAQGKLGEYTAMLRQYTQINNEFREYRRPIISDAMLVVNFAKQNFNDYSTFDAGFAMGAYPIWDDGVLDLPSYISSRLSGVTAQLGQLHNVKFSTREGLILSTPPVKFNTYKIDDGRVVPLPDMTIAEDDENDKFAGFTRLRLIAGTGSQTTTVPSDVMVNNQVNPTETLISTGVNPQAEVKMGLGTYCGNISVAPEEVDSAGDDSVVVKLERTRFLFTPHTGSVFNLPYTVTYDIHAQGKPHEAKCDYHVTRYSEQSRNWGRESFNFLGIVRREKRWDNRTRDELERHGFYCTFIEADVITDPLQKKEVDALNEMALNEAYAAFVKASAKDWHPEAFDYWELNQWKQDHKPHTWAPALRALCGGEPICNIVVEAFNSVEDIAATGATSIRTSNSLDLTMKLQRSFAKVLKDNELKGQIGFTLPQ